MDERIHDLTLIVKRASGAQKNVVFHLFSAVQFQSSWQPGTRSMHPQPPASDPDWWRSHWRLRIDRRWYRQGGHKYYFLTMTEVLAVVADIGLGMDVEWLE